MNCSMLLLAPEKNELWRPLGWELYFLTGFFGRSQWQDFEGFRKISGVPLSSFFPNFICKPSNIEGILIDGSIKMLASYYNFYPILYCSLKLSFCYKFSCVWICYCHCFDWFLRIRCLINSNFSLYYCNAVDLQTRHRWDSWRSYIGSPCGGSHPWSI